MITGLLFALASALVLVYVLLPLARRRPRPPTATFPWSRNGQFRARDEEQAAALEALRDLAFEFQLGNLTAEDYERLRERYHRQALTLLQAAETANRELDEAIEVAVQRLRDSRAQPGIPQAVGACPQCGTLARAGDRFCTACGAPLKDVGAGLRPAPTPRLEKGGGGLGRLPRWAAVSGGLALLFAAGIGAVYFQARGSASQPEPIGQAAVSHAHGLLVSPQDPATIYLGHHDGLQVSHDRGRTWAAVPSLRGDIMGMVSHPAAPALVYLTGHDVLLKSSDGGGTWAPLKHDLPGTDIHALAVHPDQPQALYAFVVGHGLYRSADGGTSWARLSERLPASTSGIAVLAGRPEVIYLATQDQGVLVSSDGGRSWGNASGFVNGALPTRLVKAIVYDPKSGDRFESGGGSFTGALYVATDRGVFKSTDGGGSWNGLPLKAEVTALALDPVDSRVLVAADSRGQVYRSPDRGLTWRGR